MTQIAANSHTAFAPGIWRRNWRLYAMDGALLGLFMVSACSFVALVEHRLSPVRAAIASAMARRALIGLAMGTTAICLIYSRWGKRSGALMNPAVTLSHFRLGRISGWDAFGYIAAQFTGGSIGVALMALVLGRWVTDPSVNYAATRPGLYGPVVAWIGEFSIAMVLMTVVMAVNKVPRLAPYTGFFAAGLVLTYITFEAPISGMSMNPARTFSSAVNAGQFMGLWIYFTAPLAGMLTGIELHRALGGRHQLCGKFSHSRTVDCHVRCRCLDKDKESHLGIQR
jgi:aquaporin Z